MVLLYFTNQDKEKEIDAYIKHKSCPVLAIKPIRIKGTTSRIIAKNCGHSFAEHGIHLELPSDRVCPDLHTPHNVPERL